MKTPLFHLQYEIEQDEAYTERGADNGAKLSIDNIEDEEVKRLLKETADLTQKELLKWLNINQSNYPSTVVIPLTTITPEALSYRIGEKKPKLLYITRPLHTIENLNQFLYTANEHLEQGAYICCHSMTASLKRMMLEQKYPWGIRTLVVGAHYLWHRVCPKLRLTNKLYYTLTHGKNRTFPRVEVLGRLYRAGFEVIDEQFRHGEFFVVARKVKAPVNDTPPTGSPIIHLRHIQSYVYEYQHLEKGGKFKDDYRVNFWGTFLRKVWLDELPMVWNMLRGDMKLVGVRPLSRHYFSLYTPEMQELRTRTKPGLLPPFYYDRKSPETIEEVQESERRYLEAYLKAPRRTDWRYFWGIVGNIIFHHKKSS